MNWGSPRVCSFFLQLLHPPIHSVLGHLHTTSHPSLERFNWVVRNSSVVSVITSVVIKFCGIYLRHTHIIFTLPTPVPLGLITSHDSCFSEPRRAMIFVGRGHVGPFVIYWEQIEYSAG